MSKDDLSFWTHVLITATALLNFGTAAMNVRKTKKKAKRKKKKR